jgi:hypothetical protein
VCRRDRPSSHHDLPSRDALSWGSHTHSSKSLICQVRNHTFPPPQRRQTRITSLLMDDSILPRRSPRRCFEQFWAFCSKRMCETAADHRQFSCRRVGSIDGSKPSVAESPFRQAAAKTDPYHGPSWSGVQKLAATRAQLMHWREAICVSVVARDLVLLLLLLHPVTYQRTMLCVLCCAVPDRQHEPTPPPQL